MKNVRLERLMTTCMHRPLVLSVPLGRTRLLDTVGCATCVRAAFPTTTRTREHPVRCALLVLLHPLVRRALVVCVLWARLTMTPIRPLNVCIAALVHSHPLARPLHALS